MSYAPPGFAAVDFTSTGKEHSPPTFDHADFPGAFLYGLASPIGEFAGYSNVGAFSAVSGAIGTFSAYSNTGVISCSASPLVTFQTRYGAWGNYSFSVKCIGAFSGAMVYSGQTNVLSLPYGAFFGAQYCAGTVSGLANPSAAFAGEITATTGSFLGTTNPICVFYGSPEITGSFIGKSAAVAEFTGSRNVRGRFSPVVHPVAMFSGTTTVSSPKIRGSFNNVIKTTGSFHG